VGCFFLLKWNDKSNLHTGILLLLWLLLPLLRTTLPFIRIYGELRQVMEILPVLSILAGLGVWVCIKKWGRYVGIAAMSILFIWLTIQNIHMHPFENIFFNVLAGGLQGAQEKHLVDDVLSYGTTYRQLASWLNTHAERNAKIAFSQGKNFALSQYWLRDDLHMGPDIFSGYEQEGEYVISTYFPDEKPFFRYQYIHSFLKPVYELKKDGLVLATIYKNDKAHLKKSIEQVPIPNYSTQFSQSPSPTMTITFDKEYRVTRMFLVGSKFQCLTSTGPFYDEILFFLPKNGPKTFYGVTDRKMPNPHLLEIDFDGEKAQQIQIVITNALSCFLTSNLAGVYALK
jgi:hypothetical protein